MPRVLVLLAAFDGARWIRPQIASILCQSDVATEVAVRDDGSSDETPAVLKDLAKDGQIQVEFASESSGSAAQNFFCLIRGHPAEGFDYVAFSDQDDIWHPLKLARATAALADGSCEGYSCATTAMWS